MKNFKKIICMLMVCTLFMASAATMGVYATTGSIGLTINGKVVKLDQPPISENGRTLVPLRVIFESLGAQVQWDNATQTITGTRGNTTIKLTVGSKIATVNGKQITLDVPAKVINGRTLVPARFVAENLGAVVEWDSKNRMVKVISQGTVVSMVDVEKSEEYIGTYLVLTELMTESISIYSTAFSMLIYGFDVSGQIEELKTINKEIKDEFESMEAVVGFTKSRAYMRESLTYYDLVLTHTEEFIKAMPSDDESKLLNSLENITFYINKLTGSFEKAMDSFIEEVETFESITQ